MQSETMKRDRAASMTDSFVRRRLGRLGSGVLGAPLRRWIALLLVASLPVASTGCFGNFALTRKVYAFNKEIDQDKWIRWIAFLALNVVPVYGFASTLDALFANSVEFWTGKNPITASAGPTHVAFGPAGERVESRPRADGSLDLWLILPDGSSHYMNVAQDGAFAVARNGAGDELARVTEVAGQLLVERASD